MLTCWALAMSGPEEAARRARSGRSMMGVFGGLLASFERCWTQSKREPVMRRRERSEEERAMSPF